MYFNIFHLFQQFGDSTSDEDKEESRPAEDTPAKKRVRATKSASASKAAKTSSETDLQILEKVQQVCIN